MERKADREFIPALKYDWLTPFYDGLIRSTMREARFKRLLIEEAAIKPVHRVLDLGCGTGTLALLIKKSHPEVQVYGIDADRKAIAIAKEKARKANAPVFFIKESATHLSYEANSLDRVLSSLFFHHLKREDKVRAFQEAFRVLRSGGEIHIADWGKPQNPLMRLAFFAVQLLDGFETTTDNVKGLLPELLHEAGFRQVEEGRRFATMFGTLALYRARKP